MKNSDGVKLGFLSIFWRSEKKNIGVNFSVFTFCPCIKGQIKLYLSLFKRTKNE